MGIERGPQITVDNNDIKESKTLEDLKEHLKEMGLQVGGLVSDWIKFVEFNISYKNLIEMEVKRPDGNLTRCCLVKSSDSSHNYVYLQIETNIKPDDINFGTESHGIFPVSIVGIGCSAHIGKHCYDSIDFITSNGGRVCITNEGTIDFNQGKF